MWIEDWKVQEFLSSLAHVDSSEVMDPVGKFAGEVGANPSEGHVQKVLSWYPFLTRADVDALAHRAREIDDSYALADEYVTRETEKLETATDRVLQQD